MQRERKAGSSRAKQSEQVRQGGSEGRPGTGTGQVVQDLGFNPEGGGDTGGLWAKEGWGPESGAQRHPLVAAAERTDMRDQGTRAEAVER